MLGLAILPSLSARKRTMGRMYRYLVRLCLLTLPALAIAVASATPLFLYLVDHAFAFAGHPSDPLVAKYPRLPWLMILLAAAVPVQAMEIATSQYAIAAGHPKAPLRVEIVSLVLTLLFVFPASEVWGVFGVAASLTVAGTVKALAFIFVLWKENPRQMRLCLVWTFWATLATWAVLIPIYVFREETWNFLIGFLAIGAYALALACTHTLDKKDLIRLWRAIHTRDPSVV